MAASAKRLAASVLLGLLFVGAVGGMGCSALTDDKPPLPDSTFARVLADLHMATARANRFTQMPPSITDSVFAHHGVQREDFDATFRYYTRRPDAFASLYDTVIDTLSALRGRRWDRPADPPPPDSASPDNPSPSSTEDS